MINDKSKVK